MLSLICNIFFNFGPDIAPLCLATETPAQWGLAAAFAAEMHYLGKGQHVYELCTQEIENAGMDESGLRRTALRRHRRRYGDTLFG
jgi:hypothetical protein